MLSPRLIALLGTLCLSSAALCAAVAAPAALPTKPRLVVLTDIENEPDDTQSLVRLLLYANDNELRELERPDPRPLWVSVWGGANTLAQALHSLQRTRSTEAVSQAVRRLRVYAISDQDDTGAWLRRQFPDLFYVVSPGGYGNATWGAMYREIEGIDNSTVGNDWIASHIQQGHGPLGAVYPDIAYGMEGDTPSFLGLIPNGLNWPDKPNWGGWGGRYELYTPRREDTDPNGFNGGVPIEAETRPIWTNAVDRYRPYVRAAFGRPIKPAEREFSDAGVTLWRWREAIQNDFAARMLWTTRAPAEANHAPVVRLAHPGALHVRAGDWITLDASASTDPDGDSLSFLWFVYPEAGTLKTPLPIGTENLARVRFQLPEVEAAVTAHVIVQVTDKGTPALSRYQRVILQIEPRVK